MSAVPRVLGAIAVGLGLASLPYAQFGIGGGHAHTPAPHADHAPRFDGALLMVGDHHVEIAFHGEVARVFVSDAQRRPLRGAHATVDEPGAPEATLVWRGDHFEGPAPRTFPATLSVRLRDGTDFVVPLPAAP